MNYQNYFVCTHAILLKQSVPVHPLFALNRGRMPVTSKEGRLVIAEKFPGLEHFAGQEVKFIRAGKRYMPCTCKGLAELETTIEKAMQQDNNLVLGSRKI